MSALRALKYTCLCTSVLSGGLFALISPATAACVDTANSTTCASGTSLSQMFYTTDNPLYVSGNFLLGLDAYIATQNIRVDLASGNADVTLKNGSLAAGIQVIATNGQVNVDVQDTSSITSLGNGIEAFSSTDSVTVKTGTGDIATNITGSNIGISARSDAKDVLINSGGNASGDAGIIGQAQFGKVVINTAAGTEVKGSIYGMASLGQDIQLNIRSRVTSDSLIGIYAISVMKGNVTTFDTVSAANGVGIYALHGGNNIGDLIEVHTNGDVLSSGAGPLPQVAAIYADAAQGGSVLIEANAAAIAEKGDGIRVNGTKGNVDIVTGGSSNVKGLAGKGITAESVSGTGSSGNVTITTNGLVSGTDEGIYAVTDSGSSNITANGIVSSDLKSGIVAYSSLGDAIVTTGAAAVVTSNLGADGGIYAYGITSTVNNNGTAKGLASGVTMVGKTSNTINNGGTIENLSLADADLAIVAKSSATLMSNAASGRIVGRIETIDGAFDDTLNNLGLWQTVGTSDFGTGTDIVNNSGTLKFSSKAGVAETTKIAGVENFANSGLITSQDQTAGDGSTSFDALELSGNYVGSAGSVFGLDAFLGGPGSLADVVTIDGNSSGSTAISIRSTNPGNGAANTAGILLVNVKGSASASDFRLTNGPINQGFFIYDLKFISAAGNNQFLLVSRPGTGSNEAVVAVDGIQGIWQGGVDTWSRRQDNLRDEQQSGLTVTAVSEPSISETKKNLNVWSAFRGDWTQLSSQSSFTYLGASNNFNVGYNQSTYGIDGGLDFGEDVGSGKLLFGIVAGYASSSLKFKTSANYIDYEGGTLGAYASYITDGIFADVLVKNDWLGLDYTIPGTGKARTNGRTLGASADLGYRFGSSHMFLEPMLSYRATTTDIDQFTIGGGTVIPGTNTSSRVGAGARFGVSEEAYAASLTGRLWNGIGNGNAVQIAGGGPLTTVNDPGLYNGLSGEVSGSFAFMLTSASNLFAGGSVHFNQDASSATVNGGLNVNW
jgi:outer membrane autotransporter protein